MHLSKRAAAIGALLLAGSLALAACGGEDFAAPSLDDCPENPNDCNSGPRAEGGEITWLINQGWDSTWNRMTADGNTSYLKQALAGLFAEAGLFRPDGEWEWNPDLWDGEPELVSEDPQTMVYRIRDEAVWNDGTPITVDDITYHWYVFSGRDDHCDGCTPPATNGWADLESIEGTDDGKTITITYQEDVADPEWFARFEPFYPAHVARAAGFDLDTPEEVGDSMEFFTTTVPDWSAGPYLVESAVVDERVVMVPNENWYGVDPDRSPTLDRINKVVISDQGSWIPALNNAEIEGGWPASFTTDFAEQVKQVPGMMSIVGSGGAIWEHVDINMDSLTDPALRKALFTAIDTEHARTAIWGDIAPPLRTNHIFSELSPYHEDHLTGTGYGTGDVEAARAILEEAGYTGAEPGGTLVDPDGEEVPELRFAFLAGNENRATFTELAISYLDEIGVTVVPAATPAEQLGTVLGSQDFDLVIFGWVGSPLFTGSPHQFYHSTSESNYGKLDNPQIDELVDQARSQIDVADSAVLANQVAPLVVEEAYVLPLWDNPSIVFMSDRYINLRPNFHSQLNPLYNQEEWGVALTE